HETRDVRVEVHDKDQGRRVMKLGKLHPGISPLSRYGDCLATILPSVLPAAPCKMLVGLHRFEPVARPRSLLARAMLLTRQGTSLSSVTPGFRRGAGRFRQPLHVAMQLGLYLQPQTRKLGV